LFVVLTAGALSLDWVKDKAEEADESYVRLVEDLKTERRFNEIKAGLSGVLSSVREKPAPPPLPRPDLGIALVFTKLPALVLRNVSDAIVRDPKFTVVLWNIDSDQRDPLPIPVQVGDYIRPHRGWGPNNILGSPQVKGLYKEGDRLFGCVRVLCPDCIDERDYWVFIQVGNGGWYARVPDGKYLDWNWFFRNLPELRRNLDGYVSSIPIATKIPIRELD